MSKHVPKADMDLLVKKGSGWSKRWSSFTHISFKSAKIQPYVRCGSKRLLMSKIKDNNRHPFTVYMYIPFESMWINWQFCTDMSFAWLSAKWSYNIIKYYFNSDSHILKINNLNINNTIWTTNSQLNICYFAEISSLLQPPCTLFKRILQF
jgi:hypothetical protein